MSKIPLLSALEIIKILASFGYKPVRQTGSHIHLLHPETNRLVTVPNHPEIASGTLLSILKQANIEPVQSVGIRIGQKYRETPR